MNDRLHAVPGPEADRTIGEVQLASEHDVALAVERARAAQPGWAELAMTERASVLEVAADLLEPDAEALSALLASESGKPIAQARFEVDGAIGLLRPNAVEGRRMEGRVLPTGGNLGTERDLAFTRREPLGVVAAVIPFDFPTELFVGKCAAALVGGNAVVAKPPIEDPLVVARRRVAKVQAWPSRRRPACARCTWSSAATTPAWCSTTPTSTWSRPSSRSGA